MKYCIWIYLPFLLMSCNDINKGLDREIPSSEVKAYKDYNPESALDSLGIVLRDQGTPVANYVHAVRTGNDPS